MPAETTNNPDEAKRESILTAATQIFASQGFRGADVQLIADRSGVGKGTVYRYFGDKQDLFWATVDWVVDKLHWHLKRAIANSARPLDQLTAACVAYGEFFEANPDDLEIFVLDRAEFRGRAPEQRQQRHEEIIEVFTQIIERGIAAGEIVPLDARMAVLLLGSALYGAVVFAAYPKVQRSVAEMATYAGESFVRGIRQPGAGAATAEDLTGRTVSRCEGDEQ
jgi:AcrR family transcriptional regulator